MSSSCLIPLFEVMWSTCELFFSGYSFHSDNHLFLPSEEGSKLILFQSSNSVYLCLRYFSSFFVLIFSLGFSLIPPSDNRIFKIVIKILDPNPISFDCISHFCHMFVHLRVAFIPYRLLESPYILAAIATQNIFPQLHLQLRNGLN